MDHRDRIKGEIITTGRLLFKAFCGEAGEFAQELDALQRREPMGKVKCAICGREERVPTNQDVRTLLPSWAFFGSASNALCHTCKRK